VRTQRLAIVGAGPALCCALVLTGCSSSAPNPPASSSNSAASPTQSQSSQPSSPSDTPSPTTPAPSTDSPFSGRPGGLGKPVLIVKFDNTPNAQPHSGLTKADLVYIEEVEYGLTRLAAVFSTDLPSVIGPARSARISDIDLLAQFGQPAFGYSGSQHKLHPLLAKASIYDVSGDAGGKGWFRDHSRRAPYNFMGRPAVIMTRAPNASGAADIGFQFSVDAPAGGSPVKSVTATYPGSSAKFTWNTAHKNFDIRLNGKPARATEGGTQHATTVVIQYVKQYDSGFGDKFGGRTPMLVTVGTGKGLVLRDGLVYPVTWSRPILTGGTTFTGADGTVVTFAPGQVWVALLNKKTPAHVV